ncbi:MAG: FMN-binding protein [Leptospiraceae bacterium]|nr:FMN-binding protein [Leptospiraceae bacterium]
MNAVAEVENTAAEPAVPAVKPPTVKMVLSLTLIATVSGILIVLTHFLTKPVIDENKRVALQNSITAILPGTVKIEERMVLADGKILQIDQSVPAKGKDAPVGVRTYTGLDKDNRPLGIVVEASGTGFQDIIAVIYAYDPGRQLITGMTVMSSKETPGLGDKIESDQQFHANFKSLDVRLNAAADGLEHAIIAVKNGQKTNDWQVEGITGATISSKAVAGIMNASTTSVLPQIQKQISAFGFGQASAARDSATSTGGGQ